MAAVSAVVPGLPSGETAFIGIAGVCCSSTPLESSAVSGAVVVSESHGSAWDEVWVPSCAPRWFNGMAPVSGGWAVECCEFVGRNVSSWEDAGSIFVRAEANE